MYGPGDVRLFDRLARAYDLAMPAARRESLAAGLALAERPVNRVIDLGGGTGRAVVAVDARERIVLDAARGMLERARDRPDGLGAVRGDAGRLPFADGVADAALIVDALHHVPNQTAALSEAARVLKPGGVLVIRELDPDSPLGRLSAVGERALGMRSIFTGPDDLARAVDDAGFDPAVVERPGPARPGYTLTGVKHEAH